MSEISGVGHGVFNRDQASRKACFRVELPTAGDARRASPAPRRRALLPLCAALALAYASACLPAFASVQPELPLPVAVSELAPGGSERESPAQAAACQFGGASRQRPSPDWPAEVQASLLDGQHAFADFPDGMRLLVQRGGRGFEDLDPVARVLDQRGLWREPLKIGRERWNTAGALAHLSLSVSPPHATLGWFSVPDGEARILVSQSPDAGLRWTASMRADLGRPEGRLATATLRDGSILVCWLELPGEDDSQPGGLYLRRYAPNGASTMPALVALLGPGELSGTPRLSVLEDGGDGTGALRLDYLQGESARALRLGLPGRAVLQELDHSCRCGPPREPGHPVRARILSLDTKAGLARISHGPVPGWLRPAERGVRLAPADQAGLAAGDEVLARLEERDGGWRLLALRKLGRSGAEEAR